VGLQEQPVSGACCIFHSPNASRGDTGSFGVDWRNKHRRESSSVEEVVREYSY
jgi:hypothetical protein